MFLRADLVSLSAHNHLGVDGQKHSKEHCPDTGVDQTHNAAVEEDAEDPEKEKTEGDCDCHSEPLREVEFSLTGEQTH